MIRCVKSRVVLVMLNAMLVCVVAYYGFTILDVRRESKRDRGRRRFYRAIPRPRPGDLY